MAATRPRCMMKTLFLADRGTSEPLVVPVSPSENLMRERSAPRIVTDEQVKQRRDTGGLLWPPAPMVHQEEDEMEQVIECCSGWMCTSRRWWSVRPFGTMTADCWPCVTG